MSTSKEPVAVGPALTLLRVKTLHTRIDRVAQHYRAKVNKAARIPEPATIARARRAVQAFDKKQNAALSKAGDVAQTRINKLRYDCLFKANTGEALAAVEEFEREARRA